MVERAPARRRPVTTAVSAVVLLAVAGVGCDDDPDPDEGGPDDRYDLTEPGSTLELGETATVRTDDGTVVLGIAVEAIEQGRPADLEPLDRPEPGSETPYYVTYELELVAGAPPSLPLLDVLTGWADDTPLTGVNVLAPFATCTEKTLPSQSEEGTTVEGCLTFVTQNGAPPLDRVQFEDDGDYDAFDGHQISWG